MLDVEPDDDLGYEIEQKDAQIAKFNDCDYIITNPPFSQEYKNICFNILKNSINSKNVKKGVWFLLPFNWCCNNDFQWAMKKCKRVVPIGRIKWIKGSKHSESKDCAWFYFTKTNSKTIMESRSDK